MWLGFPIHEAIATQSGKKIMRERRTNEDFAKIRTPSKEVTDIKTLRKAFSQVPQMLYPSERPNAVRGHHPHFIQLLMQQKVDSATGYPKDFVLLSALSTASKALVDKNKTKKCLSKKTLASKHFVSIKPPP